MYGPGSKAEAGSTNTIMRSAELASGSRSASRGGSASEDTRRPTSVAPAESPNSVARRAARAVAASKGSRSARSADASSSSTS